MRVSRQIDSSIQDSPIISRRVFTSIPAAGLSKTKSPYQNSPILSRRGVKYAPISGLPETAVRASSATKSLYQGSPILSRRVFTSLTKSGFPESPVRVTSQNMSPYQGSPILPRRVITSANTANLTESPVRLTSQIISPKQDIHRSPKNIRNKPKQGLKRKRSQVPTENPIAPSKIENIYQKTAQKSLTCPGCENTFSKEHGLRKHLQVNPMCTYSFFITC